ncbi:hypothetical protein [Hymenobacter sp. GOD-10R]|uniref:hypothetical protein n=1 Tax=Hymenobacter sp. GOD-10R TaxID=3093922 RepID=UPI002D77A37F|nr:hypothetical protein [Hymenobacter sp. GOD-10R]WRQ26700.1 hypothetical protein SD425_16630 [Hymenobacter sp. GOD-10R]
MATKQRRTKELLARLERLAWQDANCAAMVAEWRFAAAHVSGVLSMKLELLPYIPKHRAR